MKIKPQDLRIGNVLTYLSSEGPMYCRVDAQDLQWLCDNPKDFNEKHQVVELTEELLIKLGAVNVIASVKSYHFKNFVLMQHIDGKWYARINNLPIVTLSQLQNVYYFYTGTELNVSELFTS